MTNTDLLTAVNTAADEMTVQQATEWLNEHTTVTMNKLAERGVALTDENVTAEMRRRENVLHDLATGRRAAAGVSQAHAGHLLVSVTAAKVVLAAGWSL